MKLKKVWYKSPCLPVPEPMDTTKLVLEEDTLRLYPLLAMNQSIDLYVCIGNLVDIKTGKINH